MTVKAHLAHHHNQDDDDEGAPKPRFPHSGTFKTKFTFVKSGEPPADPADEAEEPNPYLNHDEHWRRENRPAWQQHSSLGPNVNPEGRVVRFQPLEVHVNPPDHDYSARKTSLTLAAARLTWDEVRETSSVFEDATLHRGLLGDDFQQLFVEIFRVKTLINHQTEGYDHDYLNK